MDNIGPLTHGVTERLPNRDELDERMAEIRVNGYTVLDSGLSLEEIESLKEELLLIYARQCEEIPESELARLKDTDIVRCALSYSERFLSVATNPKLLALCERVFGKEFVLMQQNGIINRPDRDNYQVRWHRDISYQHWTSSKPIAINALLCLDTFTTTNGATFVLPGTHLVEQFPTPAFVAKWERQCTVPAGSFLVLDAMLFHRGGINVSSGIRRALNHVVGLPFMGQQVDIRSAIEFVGEVKNVDPAHEKYLGYRWSAASSADDWRRRRL